MLCGCYDYHELNDLMIVSSILIDYEDGEYKVNVEVSNPSKDAKKSSFFVEGTGSDLESALNVIFNESRFQPFYSHLNVIIVSEKIAKRGIDEFFDYLLREIDIRKDFYVLVTDDIQGFLDFKNENEESVGALTKKLVKNSIEQNGQYRVCNFREIIYFHLRNGAYILSSASSSEDKVKLEKNYVFKNDKLAYEVEERVALFSNIVNNKNSKFQIGEKNTFEVHDYKLDKKIEKNKIILNFSGRARLVKIEGNSASSIGDLEKLKSEVNDQIIKLAKDNIDYARKNETDIFNFNYWYYLHYPKLVESNTWKKIEIEVNSDVIINEKGLLYKTIEGGSNEE